MLKNQKDVEVLKPELQDLDGILALSKHDTDLKSFSVYRECANPGMSD
jgi:hypothetical protein